MPFFLFGCGTGVEDEPTNGNNKPTATSIYYVPNAPTDYSIAPMSQPYSTLAQPNLSRKPLDRWIGLESLNSKKMETGFEIEICLMMQPGVGSVPN